MPKPTVIKRGSVAVRIYKIPHSSTKSGFVYAVAWHSGGRRLQKQFTDPSKARAEAVLKAEQLAAGQLEAAELSRAERDEYITAREAAGGVPLLSIVQEWQKARTLVGPDLMAACEAWSERHGIVPRRTVTVAEAVAAFLKAKRADHVNTKAGYERSLPGFEKALGSQAIATLTPDAIAAYLANFKNAGSRNSHHKRITALFRWCRKRGLLPLDVLTASERVDRARAHRTTIGLVTPEQLRSAFALVVDKAPQYVPALVVAAFCGLRRAEVHGQTWEHIDLARKSLRVSAAKPNTPARRLVPIPDCALEWLLSHQTRKGPICTNLALDRIRDICRTAGLDLADNGFRHSWISSRVEITGDIPRVSIEAGNTPAVIHRHYRELMRREEAEAWFDVRPTAPFRGAADTREGGGRCLKPPAFQRRAATQRG